MKVSAVGQSENSSGFKIAWLHELYAVKVITTLMRADCSRMAQIPLLSRRVAAALAKQPCTLTSHTPPCRSTKIWIRTITSTRRLSSNVSFGPEVDALLEKHKGRSVNSRKPKAPKKVQKFQQSPEAYDYEVEDFVDRSEASPTLSRSRPTEVPIDYVNDTSNTTDKPATTRKEPSPSEIKRKSDAEYHRSLAKKHGDWAVQRKILKEKFPDGWNPRKKLSPDAMDGIRNLHAQDPVKYSTPILAEQFKVSPEAIRRILKSKWASKGGEEKMEERRERWAKRHDRIWDQQAELGLRPRRKRDASVEDPDKFERELERKEILEGARV